MITSTSLKDSVLSLIKRKKRVTFTTVANEAGSNGSLIQRQLEALFAEDFLSKTHSKEKNCLLYSVIKAFDSNTFKNSYIGRQRPLALKILKFLQANPNSSNRDVQFGIQPSRKQQILRILNELELEGAIQKEIKNNQEYYLCLLQEEEEKKDEERNIFESGIRYIKSEQNTQIHTPALISFLIQGKI